MPELYKVKEVAEILRLDVVTVRAIIKAGQLPSITVGKRPMVNKEQLEKFMKGEK